ncbi:discoidin domain-containing protein [Paenibacillus senegalimassiliensis]|uniref:discoidin domain-containing protein n=1 Tax=Paenibacillus senegalimassiliensis TaxID=1737426 RepID=UPI00073FA2D7|nr:discoidin domain-containing protein [Paenibacillus senegalimassiliensis]
MKRTGLSILLSFLLLLSLGTNAFADENSEEVNLIPKMTSNNAPVGIAAASSEWSANHKAYSVFDRNINDVGWASAEGIPYGWISYEFFESTIVNKYVLIPRSSHIDYKAESPKDWTFEGWDGEKWIILDTQIGISDWTQGEKKEFLFENENSYIKYRINITKNNGKSSVTLGALEMYNSSTVTPPEPQPTVNRAILVVTMLTGLEKEYDLSMDEVNAFINWYDTKDEGSGPSKYAINKHDNNRGPFSKRTDYVIFNNILTFEISEYSTVTAATYH